MTTKEQKLKEVEAKLDKKDLFGYSVTSSGNVVLRMTAEDYYMLLMALGMATGSAAKNGQDTKPWIELVNKLNEGNPDFVPYTMEEGKDVKKSKTR
jgi:hypothetical protein